MKKTFRLLLNWLCSPRFVLQLLTYAIVVLLIYVSIDLVQSHRAATERDAGRRLESMNNLTTMAIAHSLDGVREALRLLSRLPVLREHRYAGMLIHPVNVLVTTAQEIAETLEEAGMFLHHAFLVRQQKLERLFFLTQAAVRRLAVDLVRFEFPGDASDMADIPGLLPDSTGTRRGFHATAPRIPLLPSASLLFGRAVKDGFQACVLPVLAELRRVATFLDSALLLGNLELSDPSGARNLLSAGLSDRDLIRSFSVKSLAGVELAAATEITESRVWLGTRPRSSTFGHRPFYSGPVVFNQSLHRPLWEAIVPLRDRDREAFAMLSAQVDLAFLSELAGLAELPVGGQLFVVDEDGVIIGHSKQQEVVRQTNVFRGDPRLKRLILEEQGVRNVFLHGTDFLAVCRRLHSIDKTNLPGWSVVAMAPAQRLTGSMWWPWVCGMMIATVLIRILLFVSEFIIDHVHDDEDLPI